MPGATKVDVIAGYNIKVNKFVTIFQIAPTFNYIKYLIIRNTDFNHK